MAAKMRQGWRVKENDMSMITKGSFFFVRQSKIHNSGAAKDANIQKLCIF